MKRRFLLLFLLVVLVSCTDSEISDEPEVDKEALYGDAIKELTAQNSTPNLDKRFNYFESEINNYLSGEKELDIAQFTRIKIGLDYLESQKYDSSKVRFLQTNFIKAYTSAEAKAKEFEGTLSDRYYDLNKTIEKVSDDQEDLTVTLYFQIEKGINELEKDGYMIPVRIDSLRSRLLQEVLNELESAIIDFEIPELEEIIEEEFIEEEVIEIVVGKEIIVGDEIDEETEVDEELEVEEDPIVQLIDGGLDKDKLSVSVGDTVVFKNVRDGHYKIGLVVGNRECRDLKSGFFGAGESFGWTFTEPQTCWVSDAIFTTEAVKITVS
jgi:plastocyanin